MYLNIETRQMRLDRVLLSETNNDVVKATKIERFGDKKLEFDDETKPNYLFPSDHFGLLTELQTI